jgi:hypothetical protein
MESATSLYNIFWITVYILALAVLLFAIFLVISWWRKRAHEKKMEYKMTFLQVKLPRDNEVEVKVAENMFSSIYGIKKTFWGSLFTEPYRVSFEIIAKNDGISFYVALPDEIAPLIEKQINGAYPSAEIDIVNPHEIWDRGNHTQIIELKLKGPSYYPIKVYEDMKNDSISSITSAMSKLAEDEVVGVQYIIQPAPEHWRAAGRRFVNKIKNKGADPEKKVNVDTSFLEGVEKKTSHPGFYTKIRLVALAKDKTAASAHIQNLTSTFEQFTEVNYNRFVKKKNLLKPQIKIIDDFIYRRFHAIDINVPLLGIPIYLNAPILNTVELATVFHFPNKEIETPNIVWLGARRSSAPTNVPEEHEGIWLGESVFRGVKKQIHMKEKDRTRHFYIIGQTGTGKSELMKYMALQDIRNGEGIALIDPHGTDIADLLETMPPERKDDVILFNAADNERPLGINMLQAETEEEKHMIINAFIALLYKLYDPNRQGIMGPLLERAIRNVMLTAMADPTSTVVDVMRLLIDDDYYKKFLDKIDDPMVKRYWLDEVANTSQNRKGETMGYFVSKFDRFITDNTMRGIIGQPTSSFNLDEVMSQKKILLIDLAKGKIGEENSNFIGLLFVPRILAAAMKRHKLIEQGQQFPSFYLYVDEFQNFATPDFETILSEARKYKLNLVIAHQFVDQLPEDIKDAIFGNVGTICAFRVGPEDAEFLEKQFEPAFTAQDINTLPMGNCYAKLLVDGFPSKPFSMTQPWKVINDDVPKNPELAKEIKEMSRMKYGKPIEEINAFINERAGFDKKEEEKDELPPLPKLKPRIPF